MTSFLERTRWSIDLWLVRTHESLKWRARMLDERASTRFYSSYRTLAFLDRIDPFQRWTTAKLGRQGYQHTRIRKLVSKLVAPRFIARDIVSFAARVVGRFAPYVGPGKFEANAISDRLKVEWLYDHSEYAAEADGGSEDYGRWFAVFLDLPVPWSREPENWFLVLDRNGFVSAFECVDRMNAEEIFDGEQREYDRFISEPDEWTNREGMPEFNGSFR